MFRPEASGGAEEVPRRMFLIEAPGLGLGPRACSAFLFWPAAQSPAAQQPSFPSPPRHPTPRINDAESLQPFARVVRVRFEPALRRAQAKRIAPRIHVVPHAF